MSGLSEDLASLPLRERLTLLMNNEKIFHVIFAQQFDRDVLDFLCRTATQLRKVAKSVEGAKFLQTLLGHKSAMLYFTQPSTRTFLSFVRACQYLGMNYSEVRDPRTSSMVKGESEIDGVRTFSSYFDLIIMRHREKGFAERTAHLMNQIARPVPVISGGAGTDEHPTQALLDIYTLQRSFEARPNGIEGLYLAFMGDVARGRTVRSLAQLLACYPDVRLAFVAPEELRIRDNLRAFLDRADLDYIETEDVNEVIEDVDAVYVTRMQDEYDVDHESEAIDYTRFHLTLEHVQRMKSDAIVMHPLPRREELDPRIDTDHRAMYWRQERNGMWIRAALIAYVFNVEARILDYYGTHYNY